MERGSLGLQGPCPYSIDICWTVLNLRFHLGYYEIQNNDPKSIARVLNDAFLAGFSPGALPQATEVRFSSIFNFSHIFRAYSHSNPNFHQINPIWYLFF